MLEKVKLALRITHNYLDRDIEDTIKVARQEMIRAGVSEEVANSDNDMVENAIKTFCLYTYCNDSKFTEGYFNSWIFQLDNLRKSTIDIEEETPVEEV